MRALLLGAVESTRVAVDALRQAAGWELAGVATLPAEKAGRHSDYVDLSSDAAGAGAELIHVADANAAEFVARVRGMAPDVLFVIGWSQICGPALREAAGGRVIGYHPAPLPRLRGRGVIPWTILLDEKITGASLFWIDEGVDSGPILAQRFFHVAPSESAATLYARHMRVLGAMLAELLPTLLGARPLGVAQDERCATYAARRTRADGAIDWHASAQSVERLVRAVGWPYPGAFTTAGEREIVVWRSEVAAAAGVHHAAPGQVVGRDTDGFEVMCGDGATLRILAFDGDVPSTGARLGRR